MSTVSSAGIALQQSYTSATRKKPCGAAQTPDGTWMAEGKGIYLMTENGGMSRSKHPYPAEWPTCGGTITKVPAVGNAATMTGNWSYSCSGPCGGVR